MVSDLFDLKPLWRMYSRYAFPDGTPRASALMSLFTDIWCEETAMPYLAPEWRPHRPRIGQTDVSVLLVEHLCDADIVSLPLGSQRHFFNRLPLGEGYTPFDIDGGRRLQAKRRDTSTIISRPDFINYWDAFQWGPDPAKLGVNTLLRYGLLHGRAHFVMARAIR